MVVIIVKVTIGILSNTSFGHLFDLFGIVLLVALFQSLEKNVSVLHLTTFLDKSICCPDFAQIEYPNLS